jgi:hypothetical protein
MEYFEEWRAVCEVAIGSGGISDGKRSMGKNEKWKKKGKQREGRNRRTDRRAAQHNRRKPIRKILPSMDNYRENDNIPNDVEGSRGIEMTKIHELMQGSGTASADAKKGNAHVPE